MDSGVPGSGAILIGMLTGVVLRREIYAPASPLGAVAVVALTRLDERTVLTMLGCGVLIFVVRLTALYRRWSAPCPKLSGASGDALDR